MSRLRQVWRAVRSFAALAASVAFALQLASAADSVTIVLTALFSTMWGEDFQHRDFLLGRALARIIAHELHHVLDNAVHHSQEGLAQPRLTAASLIRGDARLYSGVNND